MTTGRINQVNGGTNKKLEPTIGFLRARLRSAHRPPRNERGPPLVYGNFRESRLSFPTVVRGAVPRTLDRRTRSVSSRQRSTPIEIADFTPRSRAKSRGPPRDSPRDRRDLAHTTDTRSRGAEGQGIAPFHGASLGKSSAPESGRPDCRIRQDARPGRDSHMAIALNEHPWGTQRKTARSPEPITRRITRY